MRTTDRGNVACVARRRQPVVHCRADFASLNRRLSRAMMAGNEENDALAPPDCLFEAMVDRGPGAIEVHAMQVQDPVRLQVPAPNAFFPGSVQRFRADRHRSPANRSLGFRDGCSG